MSENAERQKILADIAEAFAVPRPAWFVDASHCCECAEHEAELQAETVGPDSHLTSFLSYLRADRIETLTDRQRAAVERLLVHLGVALAGALSDDDYLELEWALRRVRGEPGPCSYAGSA